MAWLWFVGPLVAGLIYVLTGGRDKRREREIERWRARMAPKKVVRKDGAYRDGKSATETAPGLRRVTSLPSPLPRILEATGGGVRLDTFVLVPKLAFLVTMAADLTQASDHQTVVAKLDEAGPTFTVRPLPIVEGERAPNTGVQFKKDAEFMQLFLVEHGVGERPVAPDGGAADKAVRTWLSPPLREALLELPEGWLRVDGKAKTMAFTVYGPADADRIEALIAAADIVFAEYGAGGGPSLLGDDGPDGAGDAPPPSKLKKPKRAPDPADDPQTAAKG